MNAGTISGRMGGVALAVAAGVILGTLGSPLIAGEPPATSQPVVQREASLRQEVNRAIDRGLDWLRQSQNTNGYWSTPDHPAMTALPLMAFKGHPQKRYSTTEPPWIAQSYRYLLGCVQPDGGIHKSNLVTYNTAISMMALIAADREEYTPVIRKARQVLVRLQSDFGERGKTDDVFDGGIGYGTKYEHSDMGNTLAALEALYYSKPARDSGSVKEPDLNWQAAIQFLQNCQNLPSHNSQTWVSDDPKDRGGFVYYPGHSMAGGTTNASTGKVALRSYGSISYGGLLSYIYADLKRDDPRVAAVLDWLRKNYSVTENPGMGAEGQYFYYHTMAKALAVYGMDDLELTGGKRVNWRADLAHALIDSQQKDGSWINEKSGRWWEKDPALVTAYSVLALEMALRGW